MTSRLPLISIIIPSYNHAPFLQQRLDSVFNQSFQNFEVIILDDASTDRSKDILNPYKNHHKVSHVVFNDVNSGSPFKQWQKGISLAIGTYIWIAESDDYCDLDFLDTIFNNINDGCGLCYLQSMDVNEDGEIIYDRINYTNNFEPNIWKSDFQLEGKVFIENYLSIKNVVPNASAVVFKRCLVNDALIDGILLNMKMCGDWLFWIRICEQTKIQYINKNLNFFRNHESVSRNHNSVPQKKTRLLEEKKIRDYLFTKHYINNLFLNDALYHKWFDMHTKWDLLKSEFFLIKLKSLSYISFISKYKHYKSSKK